MDAAKHKDTIYSRSINTNKMTSQAQWSLFRSHFILGMFDIKVIAADNSLAILNVKASLKRNLVKHLISLRLPSSMRRALKFEAAMIHAGFILIYILFEKP